MSKLVKRNFVLGPDDHLTDEKLLQAVALAVQLAKCPVYVFEDTMHGKLTITTVHHRERIGFELLLKVRPHKR